MTHPSRSVVLHGHFYQPPREDPWTGEVPEQPSAEPYHDWNERIERECYGPVVEARVLAADGRAARCLNALEWMSFNFGPTLLVWLERHAPDTYAAILEADRESARRLDGRGNALAMPFHHPILPLASPRDRRTEIRWGIADFRRRFGRWPEGMWLPETAVDGATLEALAAEGIRFTILAPHQVDPVPPDGRPGRYVTESGAEVALFVYDGALAHGVAFGDLLDDGVGWAETMAEHPDAPSLVAMATDGETFGHHHEFGEMALAKAIAELQRHPEIRLESFASFLAREGADEEVTLMEPSAWSCAHGVGRWSRDCGCKADPSSESSQAWRAPLREALTWLSGELHDVYAREASAFFSDPWSARDAYGWIVAVPERRREEVLAALTLEVEGGHDPHTGTEAPRIPLRPATTEMGSWPPTGRARELLEMERNALRLFTSCAWFFDDVDGLEPRQVLAYAARAIDLAGPAGPRLRSGLMDRLADARSNDPDVGSAAVVYEEEERRRPGSGQEPVGRRSRRASSGGAGVR